MDNKLRMVVAIALSGIIIVSFTIYQSKIAVQTNTIQNEQTTSQNDDSPYAPEFDKTKAQNIKSVNEINTNLINNENFAKNVMLENDLVIAEFQYGNLISYTLKKFDNSVSKYNKTEANSAVNMVEYVYKDIYPFSLSFNNLQNTLSQDVTNQFYFLKMNGDSVEFASDVIIDGENITIKKTFALGEKPYEIINDISFENKGSNDVSFFYSYFLSSGIGPYKPISETTREDMIRIQYLRDGKSTAKKMLEGKGKDDIVYKSNNEPMNWVAIDNRYFSIILNTETNNVSFEGAILQDPSPDKPRSKYLTAYHIANTTSTVSLAKGESKVETKNIYMGPKSRTIFADNYKEENYRGIYHESFVGLNLRPLIYWLDIALNKLYLVTKNYALAIMLFTLLFKIATFPLTHKSYKSMKRMQLIGPKIERIREQYKDNPEEMNKEIWKTYKREKVSPLGGCLPTLLPFPILIAFFYLMQSMIELRNAQFLWIIDLSSPDRLFVFPEGLPLIGGFAFNLIPIIMAATSFLTMKLQPSASAGGTNAAANQMKMMSFIFPIMMLFMLYNYASGLAIYWTTQNVLALLQQLITKYIEKKKGVEALVEVPIIETKKERKKRNKKKGY